MFKQRCEDAPACGCCDPSPSEEKALWQLETEIDRWDEAQDIDVDPDDPDVQAWWPTPGDPVEEVFR